MNPNLGQTVRAKMAAGGRVVISAELRRALGLAIGDEVVLILEGRQLSLTSMAESVRQAQAAVRRHVSQPRSLADELIAERRRESSQ